MAYSSIPFCEVSPKNKILHFLPQIFFFNIESNKTEKQQGHAYGKGNNI